MQNRRSFFHVSNPGQAVGALTYATHDPEGVEMALTALCCEVGGDWRRVSRREAVELDRWAVRAEVEISGDETLDDLLPLAEEAACELVDEYAPTATTRRLVQVCEELDQAKQAVARLRLERDTLIRCEVGRGASEVDVAALCGMTPRTVLRVVDGETPPASPRGSTSS